MFDLVEALSYVEQVDSVHGVTQPVVVAVDNNGEEFNVHAKLTDTRNCSADALAREAIAAFLARDLALNIPPPHRVFVSDDFISSMPTLTLRTRFENSLRIIFGSRTLTGFYSVPTDPALDGLNRQSAADILAFDLLIGNADRGGEGAKPNCMTNGRDFVIFDHEKAFLGTGLMLFGYRSPWLPGALSQRTGPNSHLFINALRKLRNKPSFNDFMSRWSKAVTDTRLMEYRQALPPEWCIYPDALDKLFAGLKGVSDNIDGCLAELNRSVYGE